ncbi:SDR family NAD(P)-dependent oxidoreductase [Nocardioides sp. AE5]|uniref:SDR family NAD(P)-dependent oxidoreductase n=1 Tax=Nocardioides sp. AE5 TaxID=2962573 RepID=UPI0028828FD2|nr:SDR family NAD(P)-dependent oxidoreductase [Nocardioides sp. AE5]MDT0203179.1 SDR family NAD(P)-dependent oxidoreductase [Nocardioides sp. AE5]
MTIDFTGRVAIVTGAGRGLGRHYALDLAERGAAVIVNDAGAGLDGSGADSGPASEVVREIRDAGGTALASTASVTDEDAARALVETATEEFGRLDVLINNAGILRDRSLMKLDSDLIDPVLAVHLRGAFNMTVPAFRVMAEQGYGRIVMTTSAAGLFGNFGQANYAAAKMGLVGLASTVAIEGERKGVLCNTVAPVARSRMTEEIMGDAASLVEPSLVVPLVSYLCSEKSSVTQEIFSAGGGRFARVFVGVGPGWFAAGDTLPDAERIGEHIADIRRTEPAVVPRNAAEEAELLLPMIAEATHG